MLTIYEALSLMFIFGSFILLLLTYISDNYRKK